MSTTAMAVQEKKMELGLVKSHGAIILADQLATVTEQRKYLVQFVHENMKEDVDYGVIPGTGKEGKPGKPCLYKPGAEKLTDLYRCTAELEVDKEVEDWEKGFFYYRFRARIVSRETGVCLGVGIGSCNSRETKYRWRDSKPKCPSCGQQTIFKSKGDDRQGKPRTGWYCWSAKGGCGTQWNSDTEPAIVDQPRGRIENPDIADLVNTIQKMATKRAHVAAALQLAGCSDLFTQDLEDMVVEGEVVRSEAVRQEAPAATAAPPPEAPTSPAESAPGAGADFTLRARRVYMAKKLPQAQFTAWVATIIGKPKLSRDWNPSELAELERAAGTKQKQVAEEDVPF